MKRECERVNRKKKIERERKLQYYLNKTALPIPTSSSSSLLYCDMINLFKKREIKIWPKFIKACVCVCVCVQVCIGMQMKQNKRQLHQLEQRERERERKKEKSIHTKITNDSDLFNHCIARFCCFVFFGKIDLIFNIFFYCLFVCLIVC